MTAVVDDPRVRRIGVRVVAQPAPSAVVEIQLDDESGLVGDDDLPLMGVLRRPPAASSAELDPLRLGADPAERGDRDRLRNGRVTNLVDRRTHDLYRRSLAKLKILFPPIRLYAHGTWYAAEPVGLTHVVTCSPIQSSVPVTR